MWPILEPGDYFLAWQLDTDVSVASHVDGTAGDGLEIPYPFGSFPKVATQSFPYDSNPTSDQWTSYVTYTPQTAARQWVSYR